METVQTVSDFASDFLMEKQSLQGSLCGNGFLVHVLGLQITMVDSHAGPAVYSFSLYHVPGTVLSTGETGKHEKSLPTRNQLSNCS